MYIELAQLFSDHVNFLNMYTKHVEFELFVILKFSE